MKKIVALIALALAACDGKPQSPEPTASAVPEIRTAKDVVDALAAAGLPVTSVTVLDEKTDSNNLLGRPGQYTSKVMFYDGRHPKAKDGGDEGENTVEMFASAEAAKTRRDYIDGVTKGLPFLMQYQVLRGRVLLRLDKVLLPSEEKAYEAALAKIAGE